MDYTGINYATSRGDSIWDKSSDDEWESPSNFSNSIPNSQTRVQSNRTTSTTVTTKPIPGCIGLANLGFTCYLNSSIQSLSHLKPFCEYFIANAYQNEINRNNVLGTAGVLTEAFAGVIKKLWKAEPNFSSLYPSQFKKTLDEITEQFQGFEQHDCQEFLTYLLDSLHEDLNRVVDKPVLEFPDFDDSSNEKESADTIWELHLLRNKSFIVDWFLGQSKSKLSCLECKKSSFKYDPIMYLTLPIPVNKNVKSYSVIYSEPIDFSFIFEEEGSENVNFSALDNLRRRNIRFRFELPKDGVVSDLLNVLANELKINPEHLLLTEVWDNYFIKYFDPTSKLQYINESDILYAYNLERKPSQKISYTLSEKTNGGFSNYRSYTFQDTHQYLPIVFRKADSVHSYRKTFFSIPVICVIPKSITFQQLYQLVFHLLKPYLYSESFLTELDEEEENNNKLKSNAHPSTSSYSTLSPSGMYYGYDYYNNETTYNSSGYNYNYTASLISTEKNNFNYDKDMKELFELTLMDLACKWERNSLHNSSYSDYPVHISDEYSLAVDFKKVFYNRYYNFDAEQASHVNHSSYDNNEPDNDNETTLKKCLELYTEKEGLGADNAWFCSSCKALKPASIEASIWKFPRILVINLKRFGEEDEYYGGREKIETLVRFPLENLDLTDFQHLKNVAPPIYNLVAVSNHYGTMTRGHYTTYAKNCNDNNWYKFDDSNVTQINDSTVCNSSAYVLFYQRIDTFSEPSKFNFLSYSENDVDAIEEDLTYHYDYKQNLDDSKIARELSMRDSFNNEADNFNAPSSYNNPSQNYSSHSNFNRESWEEDIMPDSDDPLSNMYSSGIHKRYTDDSRRNLGSINDISGIRSLRPPSPDMEEWEEEF